MQIENSTRLSYKMMTAADADLMYQLDQDSEVMRFINGGVVTTREDINDVYIPRMSSYAKPDEGWGIWKVMLKDSDEFIGWVLVRPMHFFSEHTELDNLELGWRFAQNSWGKGYATEAANSIKQGLINKGSCSKLSAIAVEDNIASINIMKKLGMRYKKTYFHQDPVFSSEVVYYELALD